MHSSFFSEAIHQTSQAQDCGDTKGLQDPAMKYAGMRKVGKEKLWAQGVMERLNVVLAHLRRVQDGTRWIQCTRSMGEPEIKKLQEMIDMIPEDGFQSLKKKQNQKFNLEKMSMIKNYLKNLIMMAKLTAAFHQDLPSTSLMQTLVTQVLKYHWFLPPRTRSRRNGAL